MTVLTEVLASTSWVKEHLEDPDVRVVEIDVDTKAYEEGHIPGAKNIPWSKACNEDGTFKTREELRKLYSNAGISSQKHEG